MRVRFEYTIDDCVDLQMRILKHSRAARSWRLRDLVVAALLSGVVLFAIIPEGLTGRLIAGGLGVLAGAVVYAASHERTVKRRLRKFFEEKVGSNKIMWCEVELSESGVHTNSEGMQSVSPWQNVEEIQDNPDSVDIYTERGSLLVVRKRAFTSPAEQQQFLELANEYLRKAQEASSPDVVR